nr:uncharacterized protein LOC129038301 [Pongo pygmaeus]
MPVAGRLPPPQAGRSSNYDPCRPELTTIRLLPVRWPEAACEGTAIKGSSRGAERACVPWQGSATHASLRPERWKLHRFLMAAYIMAVRSRTRRSGPLQGIVSPANSHSVPSSRRRSQSKPGFSVKTKADPRYLRGVITHQQTLGVLENSCILNPWYCGSNRSPGGAALEEGRPLPSLSPSTRFQAPTPRSPTSPWESPNLIVLSGAPLSVPSRGPRSREHGDTPGNAGPRVLETQGSATGALETVSSSCGTPERQMSTRISTQILLLRTQRSFHCNQYPRGPGPPGTWRLGAGRTEAGAPAPSPLPELTPGNPMSQAKIEPGISPLPNSPSNIRKQPLHYPREERCRESTPCRALLEVNAWAASAPKPECRREKS